jgi:hypothetical protein
MVNSNFSKLLRNITQHFTVSPKNADNARLFHGSVARIFLPTDSTMAIRARTR